MLAALTGIAHSWALAYAAIAPSMLTAHTLIHNCTLSAQGFGLTLIFSNRTRSAGRV